MSARICPSCQYNVVSTVVATCPNCGTTLPATLASSSSSLMLVGAVLILVGGAAAFFLMGGPAPVDVKRPPVAPSAAGRGASQAASPAPAASPRAAAGNPADDRKVDGLIAQLNTPATAWEAAGALATIQSPRAEKALMAAYDRREYAKMGGAAAFYAGKRPPGYEKVLVDLLNQSRDLAVAQDLILSRDPKIAEPARKWAAEQGFKLVPSKKTPTGVTWVGVSDDSPR
jgi:hypothetical protein